MRLPQQLRHVHVGLAVSKLILHLVHQLLHYVAAQASVVQQVHVGCRHLLRSERLSMILQVEHQLPILQAHGNGYRSSSAVLNGVGERLSQCQAYVACGPRV